MATTSIVSILKKNPGLTANGIAKAQGKSKARQGLKNELAELVEDGTLVEDTSGRYVTYSVAGGTSISKGKTSKKIPKKKVVESEMKQAPKPLPEKTVSGFTITEKDGGKVTIKTPNQELVPLGKKESLLVINGAPTWAVKSAEDVLTCISAYATEKGYATYVVSNTATSKIVGSKDDIELKNNRILLIDIKRHNKAA